MTAKRLALATMAAASVLMAMSAPASADQIVTPAKYDFGALPIGATSATVPLTLTATCDSAHMCAPQPYHTDIATASPDFTVVSEDCPDPMPGSTAMGTSCTIMVRFTPIAVGPRGATIATGEFVPIPPGPPEAGTQGEVVGAGLCSTCFPGNSTGAQPPYVIPGPGFNLASNVSDSKKCKKKKKKTKASAAKKKCRKKRK